MGKMWIKLYKVVFRFLSAPAEGLLVLTGPTEAFHGAWKFNVRNDEMFR